MAAKPPRRRNGMKNIEYKGYDITYNFYGNNEYTVEFCGDDVVFTTEAEAKAFIDQIEG